MVFVAAGLHLQESRRKGLKSDVKVLHVVTGSSFKHLLVVVISGAQWTLEPLELGSGCRQITCNGGREKELPPSRPPLDVHALELLVAVGVHEVTVGGDMAPREFKLAACWSGGLARHKVGWGRYFMIQTT